MISENNPLGLPVEAPFNSDPLKKLISGSEEGPSADRYDPTSINGNDSEGSLPLIEETPVEDLLLVEGGEKIDAGRLVEGEKASATLRVRDPEKGDLLTAENPTEELIEDTLIGSTKNSQTTAPIQTRTNKQKTNIFESGKTDPLINPKKDKQTPNPGKHKKEDENYLNFSFDSGIFEVGKQGEINADFLYDGGVHKGEIAIFSIEGFEDLDIRSYEDFVKEAASRALSNSELGHVIISDKKEGARFDFPLGEKSRNGGKYLGHKTFEMTPGDKFALMLVPKSTVEKVFQNPKERGAKNPLFSFSTDNPDDLFWPGQLGQVNDKGGIYAWEDLRLDGKSDLDYNDIIFCLTGAKGDVSHLDDLINPKKDWRESKNAPKVLEQICHGSDLEPPIISAELVNDTGSDDTDKITSDPAITGTVIDDNYLKTFVAGFEETSLEFELIAEIDELGNFQLSLKLLEQIKGEKLEDGTHSLYLQATDDYDNKTEIYEFSFILDTKAELTLELDSEFDSLPKGDNITNFETVTLSGKTEANATVTLDETGESVIADEEGNFEFIEVGLELGENTFNATVEDLAGNEESITLTLERIKKDTEAPQISVELANDTGSDDADKITSDPTIYGTITEENEIETFLVGFDESTLEFELKNNLDSEGNFELTRELLEEIKGEKLEDGTHTFYLKATDNFENKSDISEFSFTLDIGTELTFELDAEFDSPPEGDGITEEEIVTLIGQTEPNQIVTLEGTGETVTADDEGKFEFAEVSLELGENTFNASTEDVAGNVEDISLTIERIEKNDIILLEESNFNTTATPTLELPENPSFLNIKLTSLDFDNADTDAINDALEIALVDESGQSLVQTTGSDKQAFFNWSESQEILLASGVTYDETDKLIRVNLTDIPADTTATLVFRLVNNDSDTTTTATIEDFYLTAAPDGVESPIETEFDGDSIPDPISDTEFSSLTDISASFQPEYQRTSYNEETQQLIAEYAITNEGQYPIRTPLLVAISNISDPTVKVRDPDGFTPEGIPYYNFSDKVTGDKLDPDEATDIGNLVFYNPDGVQFDYELQILGRELSGPIIDTEPDLEIIAGQSYNYDVDATHPDDDTLTYELLVSPEGMSIDGETGVIVWDTEVEDVANHAISVKVTDSLGLEDIQTFTLSVIETPPNRPPNFTSTPEVDAWINQVYNYDADATDPDNDSLKYDLIIGPEGMTVNPDTGEIEWTPPPVLVLGDTVLGRINLPGDSDEFSFSGIKGQRIYFDPLQYSGDYRNWYFDVYSPSGERVVNTDLRYQNNQIITLEETGNYRVVVDAVGDYTGSYGFSTIDVGMVPVAAFDKVIEGSLSPGSEDDVYRFTGNEGQKLFFDKLSNDGSLDWVLYGPDNKVVPGGSSSNFSDLELYLPQDGEYILTLRGQGGFDDKIDYSFEIITPDEVTTPISPGSNDEPNGIYGEIGEKGEEDFYTFEGEAGQRIYWDRLFLNAPSKSIYAQIYSPSETLIESRYFDDQDSASITLNEDGTYRVRIDATGENLGTYSFSILDPGLATPIELDTKVSDTLEPGQEAHFYSFEAEKEQRLFLDTASGTSGTNWTLYDSGNNQISHASLNTDMEVVLDDSDTYTLAIRGYNGNNPVDYSFEVITPDEREGTFAVGEIVSSDIGEKGERDVYTFTGSKGQRLFFDRLVGGSEKKVTLESPSGTKLINELSMSSDYNQHPTILPENGTYEFTVDGYLEGLGDYSFRLVDATAASVWEMDTPTEGTLNPGMGIEFYQFEGTEGERIYFQSEGNSPSSYWRLYSPDNKLLSPYDLHPYRIRALNTDFEYVLPGDGTYYLMLRGERTEETPYNIKLVPTEAPDASFELNSWVDAAIEDLGDRDVHTFSGVVGQTLYFDPRAGNANIDVQIHSPSGKLIFNGDTNGDSPPFTLTEPGIYKVSVDSSSDVTGDYSFRVTDSTTTLTLEETVSGSVSLGETALYRFEGTAGQQLEFDSLMSVSGADWVLYAPTTKPDNSLNIGSANLSNDFTRTLSVDGDYILAVRNRTDSDVAYEFQVNDVSPAPDTNEGPISTELETLRSGQISVVDEVDEYEFSVDAETTIYFDGLSSASNLMARLYAPDGTRLFNNARTNTDYGAYQLTQTGDYKLEVYGYQQATGDYNFKLVDLKAASLLELDTITDASLNSNETIAYKFDGEAGQKLWFDGLNAVNPSVTARLLNSSGEEITSTTDLHQDIARLQNLEADGEYYLVLQSNNSSDTTASFKLLNASGASNLESNVQIDVPLNPLETKVYKFDGEVGQKVWLDGLNTNNPKVTARLLNPSGREIIKHNPNWRNNYTGLPYDLAFQTLEADGEYYLILESFNTSETAASLRLLDDADATPLTLDTDVNGSFNPTGKEAFLYKFTGEEGQRLYFDSKTTTSNKYWYLVAQDGSLLDNPSLNSDFERVLPADGKYLLSVYTNGGNSKDDYEFRLVTPQPQETAILIGDTIEGQIEELGQQNTYTFTGVEGQRLWFDGLEGATVTTKLYSPANEELFNNIKAYSDKGPFVLNDTGTYRLVVDGDGASVSDYSFRFLDIDEAAAVSLDEDISGSFGPSKRELQLYAFEADKEQYVFFDREEGTYSHWVYRNYYTVYGNDDSEIWEGALSNDSETTLPYTGEYVLAFRPHISSPDEEFSLRMVTPEFETTPLTLGETVSSTISEQGEWDTYTFTGTPGQMLYFDSLEYPSWEMKAKLIAPSGKQTWSQYVRDDRGPFILDEAGQYELIVDVDANNDLHDTSYSFRLLDFADATELNLDTELSENFGDSKRETHLYKFAGTEGEHLFFDRKDGYIYNYYTLYNSFGQTVFNQHLDRDIEQTLPATDDYFLAFRSFGYDNDVYQLEVVTPDEVATPLNYGETISSEIAEPGERDFYSFEGTEGEILYFDSFKYQGTLWAKLMAPDGEEIWNKYVRDDKEPFVLKESGTYTLEIDGAENHQETGSYDFRLLNFAYAPELTLDATVSGDFELGQREAVLHRFTGNKGDYLYFDSLASNWEDYYTLYRGEKQVFNQRFYYDSELELPSTGEYVLALKSDGAEPDNYEFKIVAPELTTTPLVLGEVINDDISESGERDFYTFEGSVGQKLFFDSVEGNSNIKARLFSPTEIMVIDSHTGGDWSPFTLTETGIYRLEIDANNNVVGDYGFVLSDRSNATPLELDTPTTGTLELGNDVDLYRFDGKQGQVLNFDLDAERWSGANWVLYQPDNKALATPSATQPDFQATLPSSGLYTLAIAGSSSEPVSYGLAVTNESQMPGVNEGLNVVQSGTITEGSVDEYTFTANAGTKIFYDSQTPTPWYIQTALIAPDGNKVFNGHYASYDLPRVLEQTGEYKLQVYSYYNHTTNDYQFQLLELPSSLRNPNVNYLEIGGVVSDTLELGTEAKVYTFEGVEGLRLMFNGIVGYQVGATLYNPDGTSVFSKNDFRTGDIAPVTLTDDGLYHLVIQGQGSGQRDYSFQLLDFSTSPELAFNVNNEGTLPPGQSQFYQFEGTSGETLFFDSISGSSGHQWKLYGEGNNQLKDVRFDTDFSFKLPYTGEYALLIQDNNSTTPLNYSFRVFRHPEEETLEIITPGTGEAVANEDGSLGTFPIQIEVEDTQGGKDVQDYNVRVWADPDNSNPVITSTPQLKFGLNDDTYQYQLQSFDPDGDTLTYRLAEAPVGALIDKDTGELLWFPKDVASGDVVTFTVDIADSRGGKDTQSFEVEVHQALGQIQGAVFEDLNGNGFRDSKLVKGDNPAIVLAIDVSGSTEAPFPGPDGVETVLDAQVAATLALVDSLVGQGYGDRINIGLIPHNNITEIQDMNPASPGVQPYATPNADADNNGIPDIREILESYYPHGHNDFTETLQIIENLFDVLPGDPNLIFMSDGYGHLDAGVAAEVVANLEAKNVNTNAFGIGLYSTIETISKIDPNAVQLTDVEEFVDILAGWNSDYVIEPLIEGITVYIDENDNGVWDEGELSQVSQENDTPSLLGATKVHYSFEGLVPGTYNLRAIVPDAYTQTAPTTEFNTATITDAGETLGRWFGLYKEEEPPNAPPEFLTTAPDVVLDIGDSLVYHARAMDPDAEEVSYDLVNAPEGMSVDEESGTVVWIPTRQQFEDYYAALREERQRLIDFGRGEFAPAVVEFNVLLRARDPEGEQALQSISVELVEPNNAPVFTSTLPDNANAKVGQEFKYQAVALDADGDTLIYSLIDAPTGVVIDAETGLLSWTPTQVAEAVAIEVMVADGRGGEAVQEINLPVKPAPVLPPLNLETVPNTAVKTGGVYSYQLPTGLSFNLTEFPSGMTVDSSGLLTWTANDLGVSDVVLETADTDGNTVVQSWQVEVGTQGVNRSPVIVSTTDPSFENQPPEIVSSPRVSTRSDKVYFYQLDASDPDGDSLEFELLDAPVGMEITKSGVLSWLPSVADFGFHDVDVAVGDGLWQTVQSWSLFVSDRTVNRPPSITSVPSIVTNTERLYQYQLDAFDADGDLLLWSLDEAPAGMVVNAETGLLSWQPTAEQIGEHSVAVRVIDSSGAFVGQQFDLRVTGINTPPEIVSVPITSAAPSSEYSYGVVATDPENDPLEFGLGIRPEGMSIDAETGTISWLPEAVGSFEVEVLVTDAQGATNRQSYAVEVGEGNANRAPAIVSTPVYLADVGSAYSYDVDATDPDENDSLSYQLIAGPDGMVVDAESGVLSWSSPVLGTHKVVVGASDGSVGAAQGFVLTAIENAAPTFDDSSVPPTVAVPDKLYSYDVLATDPNGERLLYGLDDDSVALGMTLDDAGRLRWTPTEADAGTHQVTVTVTDGTGASVEQSFDVTVTADTVAPVVELRPLSGYYRSGDDYSAEVGSNVTFVVSATDNIAVTGLRLDVDGVTVAVDGNGLASVPFESVGSALVSAVAVDAAGNEGFAGFEFSVVDFSDTLPPTAILDDAISEKPITSFADVLGTVTDDGAVEYVLEVAPVAGGEFVEVASGSTAVENGKLGSFDPSLLQNDSYVLRLTATDSGGNSSRDEVVVDVAGELKLGNFRLSFTDLEIPVSGIPISVTRTYDSLNASQRDDFGYGWRLEFRDTDLRTSVRKRTTEEELLGVQSPFSEGERVYVTLPGGERTGFTFKPRGSHLNGWLSYPEAFMYHPEFVADDGSELTLRVKNVNLVRKAGTDEYVENGSGVPYNPADVRFGGVYELVTKSGVVYTIDAVSGDLLSVVDRNNNKLSFTNAGIVSSTGVAVTFERDAKGRIVGVVDPEGNRIGYEYDEFGDLVGVTDREDNTTEFVYDLDDRPHYLEEIIDPLGRSGVKTEYDEFGRLTEILDINGEAIQLEYDPDQSKHTVKDVFGNPTTYVYDQRGNIVTEVDAEGGIILRTYDADNNLLSETDADGVVTKYTYDSNGNILTLEDGDGNITRMTYNQYGKVLSVVSPTGLSMSFKYDSRGNLIESSDTNGLKTLNFYDSNGKPIRQVAPDGQTTIWSYDSKGNPVSMTDSRGNEVKATYNNNGWMQSASMDFEIDGETVTLSRSFTYDSEGRTLTSTTSQGNTQSQTYNALGKVASTTDILGNVTLYDYNDKGLLRRITLPDYTPDNLNDNPKILREYDAADRVVKETSPTGLVMEYVYDNLGRTVETILPDLTPDNPNDNPRTQTEYSKAGRVLSQTDILGNSISFDYDNLGRLKKETDILGNDTTYTYTIGGQIASITDPRNRTTSLVYDDKARLTKALFFDDTDFQVAYDELGRVASETNELGQTTRYEYDEFGRRNAIINALNERTEMEFDGRGNLLKLTDALGRTTRYEYDEYGRQTATVFADGDRAEMTYDKFNRQITGKDENGNVTKYEYDRFHRLSAMELANNARTSYSYDNLGQLIEIEDANNRATQFSYDDFGRVVRTILPMGQEDLNVFDRFGFLSSYTDFNGDTINYNYDGFGRLQGKSFSNPEVAPISYAFDPVTSQVVKVTDGRGDTNYEYDERDRLSKLTNPDGKSIAYGYDVLDNMVSLTTEAGTTEYVYDALSRLDKVKDGSEVLADYDYDAVGNLVRTSRADGTVEVRGYDLRDRLTDIETKNSVGVAISGFSYTLDGAGNRTRVEEFGGRSVDYVYDAVNRLTQEKIGDRTIDYAYDLVGNRLSRNDSVEGLTTYSYDANDRLTEMLAGGVKTEFTYDDNGSMLSRSNGVESVSYDWINDGENRLVGVNVDGPNDSSDIEYVYNAEGIRVAGVVDGARTNYLVTPGMLSDVLLEYDADGTATKDFVYGLGLVRSSEGGSDSFFHADGLGSVRLVTDTTGMVSEQFVYDAYGMPLSGDVDGFGFAGELRSGETELDYLRARYYDPELGRFISKDQFAGFFNDPMSMHDYQYAHANPVNNTDPTGYFTLQEVGTAISVAGILTSFGGSAGYVGYEYLTGDGITGDEAILMLDRWMAGFAHAVSGGLTTVVRGEDGQVHEVEHSFLWDMGVLAGTSVSFLVGFQAPAAMAGQVGATKWTANFLRVFDAVTDTYGALEAVQGLTDGQWDRSDIFNLLSLVDFGITAFTGVKGSLATWRGKDSALGEMGKTKTGLEFQKPSACFVAGTEILTPDGEVAIEDIEVGDWVIADDPTTPGEIEKRQVLQTFVREADVLVDLHVDGEVISTTEEHPFWVVDKGWVEAEDLRVGDLLITEDGVIIDIDWIGKREGDFEVYNFEVEDFHTYFVSDLEVLVHNADCKPHKPHLPQNGEWDGTEGNSGFLSNSDEVKEITKGEPIPFVDQYPDFSNWSLDEVEIEPTGIPKKDSRLANKVYAKERNILSAKGRPTAKAAEEYLDANDLTWHHVPGTKKMQLLPKKLHENVRHSGGASQARQRTGNKR